MLIRRNLIVLFIFLLNIKAFSQNHFYDIGGSYGINAFIKGNNKPSVFSTKKEFDFAYFYDTLKGFRTGISYSNDLEGGKELFLIPTYYTFRSSIRYPNGEVVLDSFSDIINAIFPQRIEVNIGPSIGYIRRVSNYQGVSPTNNQYFHNEFVADRKLVFTLDIGIRPSYAIGRVNMFFSLYTGLLLSRNFIYTSDKIELMGVRPNIILKCDFGVSLSF